VERLISKINEIMHLGHFGVELGRQRRLFDRQMAEVLFDWGYRASQHGRTRQAMGLHARSCTYGLRTRNFAAIVKTALRAVRPRPAG